MQQADLGPNLTSKHTCKREFLAEMEQVVPWAALVAVIAPYAPEGKRERPPFAVETMRRIHFMRQWFTLSDLAMQEALHDVPLFGQFADLNWNIAVPDETTILRFRRLLEEHKLVEQILALVNALLGAKGLLLRASTAVDATMIAAPSSTKNEERLGQRDPQMKQSRKGGQWYSGMKAHIGVDADSGLAHTVRGTAGNVNDAVEANTLLHGQKTEAWGDAGYQGADKRPDAKSTVRWNIAMRPGRRKQLDKTKPLDDLTDQLERLNASIRAKVEHPFRVIKRQWSHVKVRYRGLAKNTAQLHTLFARSNLWMARRSLLGTKAWVRPRGTKWPANRPERISHRAADGLKPPIGSTASHQHISKRFLQSLLRAVSTKPAAAHAKELGPVQAHGTILVFRALVPLNARPRTVVMSCWSTTRLAHQRRFRFSNRTCHRPWRLASLAMTTVWAIPQPEVPGPLRA